MASEALTRTGDNISTFKLTPGEHGKFDILIDGDLVGEHKHTPRCPPVPRSAGSDGRDQRPDVIRLIELSPGFAP